MAPSGCHMTADWLEGEYFSLRLFDSNALQLQRNSLYAETILVQHQTWSLPFDCKAIRPPPLQSPFLGSGIRANLHAIM